MSQNKELDWITERHRPAMNRRRAQDRSGNFYYLGMPGMSELMDACFAVFNTQVRDIDVKYYGCAQEFM